MASLYREGLNTLVIMTGNSMRKNGLDKSFGSVLREFAFLVRGLFITREFENLNLVLLIE